MSSVTINNKVISADLATSMRTFTLVQSIIRSGDVQTLSLKGEVDGEPATIVVSITPHTGLSADLIDSEALGDEGYLISNMEELSAKYIAPFND